MGSGHPAPWLLPPGAWGVARLCIDVHVEPHVLVQLLGLLRPVLLCGLSHLLCPDLEPVPHGLTHELHRLTGHPDTRQNFAAKPQRGVAVFGVHVGCTGLAKLEAMRHVPSLGVDGEAGEDILSS